MNDKVLPKANDNGLSPIIKIYLLQNCK